MTTVNVSIEVIERGKKPEAIKSSMVFGKLPTPTELLLVLADYIKDVLDAARTAPLIVDNEKELQARRCWNCRWFFQSLAGTDDQESYGMGFSCIAPDKAHWTFDPSRDLMSNVAKAATNCVEYEVFVE